MLPYAKEVHNIILTYYRGQFSEATIPFAIDCACGNGQISERLTHDCNEVLAFDIFSNQIEIGIKHCNRSNVIFKLNSVYKMSPQLISEGRPKAELKT